MLSPCRAAASQQLYLLLLQRCGAVWELEQLKVLPVVAAHVLKGCMRG